MPVLHEFDPLMPIDSLKFRHIDTLRDLNTSDKRPSGILKGPNESSFHLSVFEISRGRTRYDLGHQVVFRSLTRVWKRP